MEKDEFHREYSERQIEAVQRLKAYCGIGGHLSRAACSKFLDWWMLELDDRGEPDSVKRRIKLLMEDDEFSRLDEIEGIVSSRLTLLKKPNYVIFSAGGNSEPDPKILDDVAIEGRCIIEHQGWGKRRYSSDIIADPTWLELSLIANDAIEYSGDTHHIFFEGFEQVSSAGGVPVYQLSMGS